MKRVLRVINLFAALLVSAALVYVTFVGAGPLPALGPAFNPSTGVWTMAADAKVGNDTFQLAGLQQSVTVWFESDGTAHIVADTDHDLFLAVGYIHARFRLFQMDLLRRQGEGRLSEVVGKAALDSDRFELQLGLLRTAQMEWNNGLPGPNGPSDRARQAILAYSQGVNDRIDEAVRQHQLPAMFTLLGYEPQHWTPIDSLIVKGDMTQTLNFTDTPLVMALLNSSLGSDLTSKWFPILPPNPQSPYDPGPYPAKPTVAPFTTTALVTDAEAQSASALLDRLRALPPGLIATGGASNNWAVGPAKSASGGALMAGDPHLHLTLPAIWYQLTMDSPGYHVSGVSIPGTPVVLIGHNQHISWSLTDAQNQQTFYYLEQEDAAHPGQYLWKGSWNQYVTVNYDIPVLGRPTDHLTVKLSVHGPVITERGLTTTVWWAGNLPSQDLDVLLRVGQASDFPSFRDALRDWHSPTHNFVYADDAGNIGMISAGYYPQVAKGQPWLPMPGTGDYDVTGTIPYADIPQVYNPPDGIVWSANQRQVGKDYPWYIGTTSNFFDPGYRADEIRRVLSQPGKLSPTDMMALQTDTRDFLASEIVPELLKATSSAAKSDVVLSSADQQARDLLLGWDYRMEVNSPAATIWWNFWQRYLAETFDPWWLSKGVTVDRTELNDALGQDLAAWTLTDQSNPAFSFSATKVTAVDVMRVAFHQSVAQDALQLGSDQATWIWGRVHTRVLDNLAQIKSLSYGPRPDRGDVFTPLAAGGSPSTHGPSWRMVVDWGSKTFMAIYPGGQSENPASPWYTDRVDAWWSGLYAPMLTVNQADGSQGSAAWDLEP